MPRTRRTRRTRLALVGIAVTSALVGATATQASAAHVAGQPSLDYASWALGVSPYVTSIGDCTVAVGPVRDPDNAYPNYRKIAGTLVKCDTRKNTIEVWVALQKWENGSWVQKGSRGYGILFNSLGSGNWKKGSQPYCGGAGGSWRTRTEVKLGSNGAVHTVWSAGVVDPAGC